MFIHVYLRYFARYYSIWPLTLFFFYLVIFIMKHSLSQWDQFKWIWNVNYKWISCIYGVKSDVSVIGYSLTKFEVRKNPWITAFEWKKMKLNEFIDVHGLKHHKNETMNRISLVRFLGYSCGMHSKHGERVTVVNSKQRTHTTANAHINVKLKFIIENECAFMIFVGV